MMREANLGGYIAKLDVEEYSGRSKVRNFCRNLGVVLTTIVDDEPVPPF